LGSSGAFRLREATAAKKFEPGFARIHLLQAGEDARCTMSCAFLSGLRQIYKFHKNIFNNCFFV